MYDCGALGGIGWLVCLGRQRKIAGMIFAFELNVMVFCWN